MDTQTLDSTTLRIIIAAIGVVILLAIYFFGRPRKPEHGRRLVPRRAGEDRIEPVLGDAGDVAAFGAEAVPEPEQGELYVAPPVQAAALPGHRPEEFPVDRIVTLYVAARAGETFSGDGIVVAAEKAGMTFGALHIFHRLVSGRPQAGPVFSMANMVKPGYFDMTRIGELATPGVSFFIALPGPLPALDAWDAMLPCAQRVAELLGGQLLDEDRNALGRQRIAGLREDLRGWDRQHEGAETIAPPRF